MSLFSSRNAKPVLGFVLNLAVPVKMSFFFDFVSRNWSGGGKS